ncbi:2,3-diaminopropionate biosynthesis protein SbnB [Streptomyces sp. PR69]|uniref:2,3-diaminopropionate biosynthesis protein SbnB n=1 Tax=Streptomyces sp. PR69 TaxID=2984950 RepID=UPI002265532F|nr:2,3-diaminopropionate biosynthesis protein SbnB [Streptomyces sp. PR69]
MFEFSVVGGTAARDIIGRTRQQIVREVRETYLTHHAGDSVNPNSYFLRFPDKPDSRIIALPAYLGGKHDVAGIKWISSFPANIESGVPRASAALLLNDYATGYPVACLEASQISAARTAASAVLAAEELTGGRSARRLAVVGAGVIARNILEFFTAQEWSFGEVVVHDRSEEYGAAFTQYITGELGHTARFEAGLRSALDGADLIVLATTAGEPYILDPRTFSAGQTVLNISLRDIAPEIIKDAQNILDDIGHCMTANTSPHLAEQQYGHRDFIAGTLAEVMRGELKPDPGRPVIFSPFGLGVLDLAVGVHVLRHARESGEAVDVEDFFGETRRW